MDNKNIEVCFTEPKAGGPTGKVADAEVHFIAGPLEGFRLIGFTIWRKDAGGHNVTFPHRVYAAHGQQRRFDLLRPIRDDDAKRRLQDFILAEYAAQRGDAGGSAPASPEFPDLPRP